MFELAKTVEGDQEDDDSEGSDDEPALKLTVEETPLLGEATPLKGDRDQALVRPKVLILTPFKQMAFQII